MILNELFRYITFLCKDFEDLGIFPLGKGFPYDENCMPAKTICHLKPVGLLKLFICILN
jgi:hypothetical protein